MIWITIASLREHWSKQEIIEIIGEAAYQIRPQSRAELPDLPWNKIVGMQRRLVHAYFDINLDILWETVQEGLPPLIAEIEKYISTKEVMRRGERLIDE